MPVPSKREDVITISAIERRTIEVAILGDSPLICNRLSEKAKRELLLPTGRKTTAERASSLKHEPLSEFRASPYTLSADEAALIGVMSSAFKGAMMSAALDLPGAKKTQIGRLVYVHGDYTPIYGVPELFMSITRSADINRTPDVRTRAIIPTWAAIVRVSFVVPLLNERSIINLLSAAGTVAGVGDWRPEKGKGNYGQFTLVDPDDARFQSIIASGGRAAQQAAMDNPAFYDQESEDLYRWFNEEAGRRGKLKAVA